MTKTHDFANALASKEAGAFIRELPNHVGYRAARPPYHCPEEKLLSGDGAKKKVGRFDGLLELPTVYLSASPTAAAMEARYAREHGGRLLPFGSKNPPHERIPLCIIPVRVRLERVLFLEDAYPVLPITPAEAHEESYGVRAKRGEIVPVHELAAAARRMGIQGIVYESRFETGSHNLAVFRENTRKDSLTAMYGDQPLCRKPLLQMIRGWLGA